jgi:glycosyltransferase involved in cell wall biosynthesis
VIEARRVAVIHALHDGVQSMYTGVGRVANNIVETFRDVTHEVMPDVRVTLHLITTQYIPESPAYDSAVERRNLSLITKGGGTITAVGSPPRSRTVSGIWGGPDQWLRAGADAFDVAMHIAERHDRALVFAHDIVFASILNHVHKVDGERVSFIWVPHSTSRIHRNGALDRQRGEIELEVAGIINSDSRCYAGAICQFMARHLQTEFHISDNRIVPFTNGIVANEQSYPFVEPKQAAELLHRAGVPNDVPVVLFWGRAVPHKGVDVLLEAWRHVRSFAHLLVIAPPDTGPPDYLQCLRRALSDLGSRATGVFRFETLLPFAALSHSNTAAVVIPSRVEPCSLTAMEAKWYSQTGAFVILMSSVDGLVEQAVRGGTLSIELEPALLARSIDAALELPETERRKMAERAFASLSCWNFAVNHARGMQRLWVHTSDRRLTGSPSE